MDNAQTTEPTLEQLLHNALMQVAKPLLDEQARLTQRIEQLECQVAALQAR
ncbi:hypothetical protein PSQ39_21355 [Curvibacter sp. HBC28]|uniref:DUF904 domain-containing protein n=1 Tax=Curvibacter microcysteis TaxID=3026419 RepID=A0ABT5MKS7_9BURK|nr:hypothetical protein [Curvibacter sp. HBC28]MDD0817196.1 hypothetical protein [Curvibacter sp. HBC28]